MAEVRSPSPVLLVVAAFSRHHQALEWGGERLQSRHGPVALTSEPYPFVQTDYYADQMGTDLLKLFFAFEKLVPADCLPELKHATNRLEDELARSGQFPEARPLNLDPGILTLGKFQLATTKDQAHRIYLRDGIFAEVTLRYQDGAFHPWPWTYADYRQACVNDFLLRARAFYRTALQKMTR
jgi:hypothetical protein